ncbi:hypothetical protein [Leptospira noguchii]|uniref:NERD domain-containing protein n=1 Tax=Leptospira noguchii serovar Panama str. CZ214 TaxID=1001595 RepID=T0GR06_9LEPT|nr:hypothetical protein [Leptospira noguchii]EQA69826.1 hypothetical protein LEP1GSC059_1968 [Leptospira noguchii serovar Panama str. CZ214]
MSDLKKKAHLKLKKELNKDINKLIEAAAKLTTFMELQYLLYLLHANRTLNTYPDRATFQNKEFIEMVSALEEETIKYVIQLCTKFGKKAARVINGNFPILNLNIVDFLIHNGNILNSKYEIHYFIELFKIELEGKDDRFMKIHLHEAEDIDYSKQIYKYFLRIDQDSELKRNVKFNYQDLIKEFENDFSPFQDLFQETLGFSLERYIEFIKFLIDYYSEKIISKSDKLKYIETDQIDLTHPSALPVFFQASLLSQEDLEEKFEAKSLNSLMDRLIFKENNFSPTELRYHETNRGPLIRVSPDLYLISPELILDSLYVNIHYSFIESYKPIKEEYKKRASDKFLDLISFIAEKYNFIELDREFNLIDGKVNYGDIDLIFSDKNSTCVLVEAKNHNLPLEIYFKDLLKTQEHLKKLKENWEKKVLKRIDYLRKNYSKVGIPSDFKYIIVTKSPEIISHFSDLQIFTTQEFEEWLRNLPENKTFFEICETLYPLRKMNKEEFEIFKEEGFFPFVTGIPTERMPFQL